MRNKIKTETKTENSTGDRSNIIHSNLYVTSSKTFSQTLRVSIVYGVLKPIPYICYYGRGFWYIYL